jgi:hypothetical protein
MTDEEMLARDQREVIRCIGIMKQPRSIFVFGSNKAGVHGAGAAQMALQLYGAELGKGRGLSGRSYALPTKDRWLDTLPLPELHFEVDFFLAHAGKMKENIFAVTRVGCGLAGYTDEQIAPFFKDAPSNCKLPEGWR